MSQNVAVKISKDGLQLPPVKGPHIECKIHPEAIDLVKKTRGRLQIVEPYVRLAGESQSPFSPLDLTALQEDEIEQCRELLESATGSVVLPGALLGELLTIKPPEDYKVEYRIDLRTEEGKEVLLDAVRHNELMNAVSAGSTRLIIEGIEVLSDEAIPDDMRYKLHGNLRSLQDAMIGNSIMAGTVSPGERLPIFTATKQSPSFFNSHKIGFVDDLPWVFEMPEKGRVDLKDFYNRPRTDINEIYGTERRNRFKGWIERLRSGEHLMVVGPRRGGKSSFGLIAKNELEKNGDFKCVRAHEESSIKRVILTYYFTFSDDEVKKRAEQRIAEVSLAELPDVIQEITGWDGASWSNKKLLLDSDEGLDILAHYGNSDELMGLVKFIKRAKELKLPINTLSIVTNFHFQNIMSQLTEHPDNVEHAHLSAFSVEEFGLFTPEESRHLLESLLDRINTEFKTPDDRKRFIDEMIRNCSGQVEVLNLVVGLLEETGDQEQIYSNMQRNNTEYFGIYLKKMTPAQRILIASLCLAQDHRGVMRSPQANMEEVKQMQSAGYVDYHFRDAGKQTLAVHLITPEGFKLAIREAFKDLIYKLAHTHFNAYLQTRDDIDEATIELGNKLIFKDEVGTEEYARYQKAYETVRSAEADFQEIFWQAAKEGRLDINLAYKKDEA